MRQLTLFNEILPEIYRLRAHVLGISTDNIWSHMAFVNEYNLHFPLLSDFHPKGRVSRAYNVYRQKDGESARAVYVVNKHGKVAWAEIARAEVVPSAEGVIRTLEALE